MFNSGGENVYPLEVENVLLEHPAVAEASVVPVPHRIKGEVPVAMVVKAKGQRVSEDELKQFCLANAPAYAPIPGASISSRNFPSTDREKSIAKVVQGMMRERCGVLG